MYMYMDICIVRHLGQLFYKIYSKTESEKGKERDEIYNIDR